jgi:tRNA pseudouridine38-40 synthase
MVRSLVGTLLQVGERGRSPDEMVEALNARDRAAAGPVAPPHGLCLVSVEYDEGWSRPFDPLK